MIYGKKHEVNNMIIFSKSTTNFRYQQMILSAFISITHFKIESHIHVYVMRAKCVKSRLGGQKTSP